MQQSLEAKKDSENYLRYMTQSGPLSSYLVEVIILHVRFVRLRKITDVTIALYWNLQLNASSIRTDISLMFRLLYRVYSLVRAVVSYTTINRSSQTNGSIHDLKNLWGSEAEVDLHDGGCQDIFAFGPPCCPFSVLNCKRTKSYNPFLEEAAEPFLCGSRHIRRMAWFAWAGETLPHVTGHVT